MRRAGERLAPRVGTACFPVPPAAPTPPHHNDLAPRCAAQVVEKEVPGKFVGAVQQVIELGLRLLHEMGGKAQFYRDRLAQVGPAGAGGWGQEGEGGAGAEEGAGRCGLWAEGGGADLRCTCAALC